MKKLPLLERRVTRTYFDKEATKNNIIKVTAQLQYLKSEKTRTNQHHIHKIYIVTKTSS
jgi:hypothetical protein